MDGISDYFYKNKQSIPKVIRLIRYNFTKYSLNGMLVQSDRRCTDDLSLFDNGVVEGEKKEVLWRFNRSMLKIIAIHDVFVLLISIDTQNVMDDLFYRTSAIIKMSATRIQIGKFLLRRVTET